MPENSTCQSCGAPVTPPNRVCAACAPTEPEIVQDPAQPAGDRMTAQRLVEATAGEFKILRQIGSGAMGSVFMARDIALSRRVAIKVISPHLLQDETMVSRFLLEAKTVASLNHPHIVTLHAVRQVAGLHYFIMDFIDGPSLRDVMQDQGPLDIPLVQALLYQVGGALNYAHRRGVGVIHRDVKPANIMIDREGNAVVTDFGIAKIGAAQTGLTRDGSTIGTPAYMSPEQCRGKELTGASDQYALGIVAYELLSGVQPFTGEMMAVMMAHAQDTPPPLREQRPDCPAEIEAAVFRMMAKEPEDRFPTVAAAVAALGGKPFDHDDPVRDAIVSLVDSVSGQSAGLDYASPLSPITGGDEPSDGPAAEAAATLVLPAREGAAEPPAPEGASEPPEETLGLSDLQLVSPEEEATQEYLEATGPHAADGAEGAATHETTLVEADGGIGDDESAAALAVAGLEAPHSPPQSQFSTAWVETNLKKDEPRRRPWRLMVAVVVVLGVGLAPPVRARWTPLLAGLSGMGAPTGSGASVGLAAVTDTLEAGETLQLEATILVGGVFQPDTAGTWRSSNQGIATVDGTGRVTARGAGVAVITVAYDDASASTEVVVRGGG